MIAATIAQGIQIHWQSKRDEQKKAGRAVVGQHDGNTRGIAGPWELRKTIKKATISGKRVLA